ncbi:MAG: hypothetical protein ACRYE9_05775 [Janthinobacterium lividum]
MPKLEDPKKIINPESYNQRDVPENKAKALVDLAPKGPYKEPYTLEIRDRGSNQPYIILPSSISSSKDTIRGLATLQLHFSSVQAQHYNITQRFTNKESPSTVSSKIVPESKSPLGSASAEDRSTLEKAAEILKSSQASAKDNDFRLKSSNLSSSKSQTRRHSIT